MRERATAAVKYLKMIMKNINHISLFFGNEILHFLIYSLSLIMVEAS